MAFHLCCPIFLPNHLQYQMIVLLAQAQAGLEPYALRNASRLLNSTQTQQSHGGLILVCERVGRQLGWPGRCLPLGSPRRCRHPCGRELRCAPYGSGQDRQSRTAITMWRSVAGSHPSLILRTNGPTNNHVETRADPRPPTTAWPPKPTAETNAKSVCHTLAPSSPITVNYTQGCLLPQLDKMPDSYRPPANRAPSLSAIDAVPLDIPRLARRALGTELASAPVCA